MSSPTSSSSSTVTTTDPTHLLDVNVLIALTNPAHVHHDPAHRWFRGTRHTSSWATCPLTEASFLRLMLNPAVAGQTVRPATALRVLAGLRSLAGYRFLPDESSLTEPCISLVGLAGSKQVTDLHLVNLAAGHGAVLATFDSRIMRALLGDDQRHVEVIRSDLAST